MAKKQTTDLKGFMKCSLVTEESCHTDIFTSECQISTLSHPHVNNLPMQTDAWQP